MKQITFTMPQDAKAFLELMATRDAKQCINVGDKSVMVTICDGDTATTFPSITDIQMRLALIDFGLADAAEDFVAQSSDKKIKAWWDRALNFERDNPMVAAAANAMGVSGAQLDQLWILAATL